MLRFCTKVVTATCLITALAATQCLAETYRWVDKDGNVGFVDSLQKVPPQYRESAKRLDSKSRPGVPSTPFQVVPSVPQSGVPAPPTNAEETYTQWRERVRAARGELEQLKSQREVAQKEYDTLRAELYVRSFADPDADARYRARLAELHDQISQKEHELTVTIPDEARQAGVPPGVLTQ